MANTLKTWLTSNTVTTDPNDKILVLESTGKADINKVYEDMLAEDTGLRRETIVHVTTLYERICARLLMNGYQLYILETEDRKSGLKDGSMTPGRNLFVRGANLKVAGTKTGVGVTLTNSEGVVTRLDDDLLTTNRPSELTLLIPTGLADGEYELTVTTQCSSGNTLLKEPRAVSVRVHVGDGGDDRPDIV